MLSYIGEEASEKAATNCFTVSGGAEGEAQPIAEVKKLLSYVHHCLHVTDVDKVLTTPCLRQEGVENTLTHGDGRKDPGSSDYRSYWSSGIGTEDKMY